MLHAFGKSRRLIPWESLRGAGVIAHGWTSRGPALTQLASVPWFNIQKENEA